MLLTSSGNWLFAPLKRNLYILCIDLHAYSLAKTQSDFRADSDVDYENRTDEFVSRKTLRWIGLVFCCQPDAEFVLIGMKTDVVHHRLSRIEEAKEDLVTRLKEYATAYETEVDREIQAVRDRVSDHGTTERKLERLNKLKKYSANMAPQQWLTMSCKKKQWVMAAMNDLQQLVVRTKARSFEMPELYSNVLNVILATRNASAHQRSRQRVHATFVSYYDLETRLKKQMTGLTNCREIMRTLHDLGDVLWYKDLGTDRFMDTVIINPFLLIDFIRQIFDHNYDGETMPHKTLMRRPFWVDIAPDSSLVLSLKKVLHHFPLVYPGGKMQWDSDLTVPAYWRTNVDSFRQVAWTSLQLEQAGAKRHVRWEYHFTSELPDAVHDHFVVSTYSSLHARVVGPYGILWQPRSSYTTLAWRAVVERDGRYRYTVIRFEALGAGGANWFPFERFVKGMETVLYTFPGLLVTRYAINADGKAVGLEQVVEEAKEADLSDITWLPPDVTWCYDMLLPTK